jgi:RHS repeat-associated protein
VQKQIAEERDAAGKVIKRFFPQGMKLETGPTAGTYYYTRDHLGSIRALTDSTGNVRGRFSYDPYGRRSVISGDVDSDFGFAGMFWSLETRLSLTHFRAYDAELGRWLSRDPLRNAEIKAGPNIYTYVNNDPINNVDPEGLVISTVDLCAKEPGLCAAILGGAGTVSQFEETLPGWGPPTQNAVQMATCVEPELPDIPNLLPSLEEIFEEVPDVPSVADRLAKMKDIWEKKVVEADFDWLINPNSDGYGTFSQDLYEVDGLFYEISTDLARIENIPLAEAMRRLADLSGIDPRLWPNW